MASDRAATRRRYDDGLKARVIAECDAPGASVAKVAMSHGINANVVHRWRQLARQARAPLSAAEQALKLDHPEAALRDRVDPTPMHRC